MVIIGKTAQGLNTTIIENRIVGSVFYLQEEGVFASISAIVEWIFDGTRIKAALYDDNGFVAETEERVLTTDNMETKTDIFTFVFPQPPTQGFENIRLVLWSDRLARLFYDEVPNLVAGLSLNLPYGEFPATLDGAVPQRTEYTVYAEYTPTGVQPPPTTDIVPPPLPTPPVIPTAELAFETDFQNVGFQMPYRLVGLGILDGADGNYINGIVEGGSNAQIDTLSDGQKALKLELLDKSLTDRVEFTLFPYSPTKQVLGSQFLMEAYMYFPADWELRSPTDRWFIFNTVQDYISYNPKFQGLILANSPAHPEVTPGTYDLLIDHWGQAAGYYEYLGRLKDFKVPKGRWFKVSWYQYNHESHGKIALWVDDELIFSFNNVKTLENPQNPMGYFSVIPAKIYCANDEEMPKQLWITNLKLYVPLPPRKGTLDIHAYANGIEVNASIEVVDVGSFTTPISVEVDPNGYTINAVYEDQPTQTKTEQVVEGQITTVDFQFGAPPTPPVPPLIFLGWLAYVLLTEGV